MAHLTGMGFTPPCSLPPYLNAVMVGAAALLALWGFFAFANEKPLTRRWKFLVASLLLSLLSVICVMEGNSSPNNPWTQSERGFLTISYAIPHWLNDTIGVLGLLLIVLLARDYQWLTWIRLWLDTFVFNKLFPDTSPKPRR